MVSEEELSAFSDALLSDSSGGDTLALRPLLEATIAAHGFRVPVVAFGRFVACRLDPARPVAEALAALHLADLYLACGCVASVRGAAEAFLARFSPEIARVAGKFVRSRSVTGEDLVQTVVARMLVAEEGSAPRLSLYRGTGALAGFVQVTAARLAVNATENKVESLEPEAGLFAKLLVSRGTPETHLGEERARTHLRTAFDAAARGLQARERAVLAYSLCDGLSIDVIGRMYGVHRATAARWIEGARDALILATRMELARALVLTDTQLDVLLREGLSRFELSVTRCLKDEPAR